MATKIVKPVAYSVTEGTVVGLPLVKYWLNKTGNRVFVQSGSSIEEVTDVPIELEFRNPQWKYFRQTSTGVREDGTKVWNYLLKDAAAPSE